MSLNENDLREHDNTTTTHYKKVMTYGWDYNNSTPRKIAVDSSGNTISTEAAVQQQMTFYCNGDAVVNNLVIDGIYFKNDVKITKIGVFAGKSPTGANLIIDQTIAGAVQSKAATLTAGSQYEETDTTDLKVITSERYGMKITQIGSTIPGTDLQVTLHYENI